MFSNFVKCFALRRKSMYDVELAEERSNCYDKAMENLGPIDVDRRKDGEKGHSSVDKHSSNASNGSSGRVSHPFDVELVSYHYLHYPKHKSVKTELNQLRKQQFIFSWSLHPGRGQALDGSTVSLLLEMCGIFQLSHVVRFHALEMFDRFIISFQASITNPKTNISSNSDLLLYTFKELLLLRMMTCIQLASVLKGRKSHVQPEDVQKALRKFKEDHPIHVIVESQIAVLNMLDCDLRGATPLEHAECILTLMCISKQELNRTYIIVAQVLTHVYIKLDDIYKTYLDCLLEKHVLTMDPDEFLTIKFNYTLRAAAAIQFALILLKPGDHLSYLPKISQVSEQNEIRILELARFMGSPGPNPSGKSRKSRSNKIRSRSVSNPPKPRQSSSSGAKLKGKRSKIKEKTEVQELAEAKQHSSENVISKTQNSSNSTTKANKAPSSSTIKKKKSLRKVSTKSLSSIVHLPEIEKTSSITENTALPAKLANSTSETTASASTSLGFKVAKSRSVVLKSSLKQAPKSSSRVSFKTTESGSLAVQEKKLPKVTRSRKTIKSPKRLKHISASASNLQRTGSGKKPSIPSKGSLSKKLSKSPEVLHALSSTRSTGNASSKISVRNTSSKSTKAPKNTVLAHDSSYVTVVTPEFFKQLKEISSPRTAVSTTSVPKIPRSLSGPIKPVLPNNGPEKEKASTHLEETAKTRRKTSFAKSKAVIGAPNSPASRRAPETPESHSGSKLHSIPLAQTAEVDAEGRERDAPAKIQPPLRTLPKLTKKGVKT